MSCSKKPTARNRAAGERSPANSKTETAKAEEEERESGPEEDQIAEDCVAFVRSTTSAPAAGSNTDCAQCDTRNDAKEVLKFEDIHFDRIRRLENSCEVEVTIRASFNQATPGTIGGGLTGWISAEQKEQYKNGITPSGQQTYKVKIIYHRKGQYWRAAEFDRA